MAEAATATMKTGIRVTDVSRQKRFRLASVPDEMTVDELVKNVLAKVKLPSRNSKGAPVTYRARLPREGRHLGPSERVGDVLETDDEICLDPHVIAG